MEHNHAKCRLLLLMCLLLYRNETRETPPDCGKGSLNQSLDINRKQNNEMSTSGVKDLVGEPKEA